MGSQCRYVSEAFINFLLLSAVLFPTSCVSKSFMILFSVSYLWAVLLLSYSGGSGSFITDPSLISTLICMLHWTPIRKAVVLVEMMSFLVRLRENNSFIAFFFPLPLQRLTTIHNQFSPRRQSVHNAHAVCSSSLNISFSLEKESLVGFI